MEESDYGDQFDLSTFERRVLSVVEPGFRRNQVRRHLLTVPAQTAAEHIEALLQRCNRGDSQAEEIILSTVELIETHEDPPVALAVEAIDLHARTHGMGGLSHFLLDPAPARIPSAQARLGQSKRPDSMSLGERRALAAGWSPKHLERLLHDDDPMVIERLCANPRVQPQHIMQIITRRPCPPAVLVQVTREPRWFRRREIRYALASNPYTPTGISLRILPTLGLIELQRLRNAGDLHEHLRTAAQYWIDTRTKP